MNLSVFLVVVSLTPACLKARQTQYEACQKARVAGAVCVPPQAVLGQSLTVGRPEIKLPQGADEACLQVEAAELSGKTKVASLKDWNAKADKGARSIQ